MPRWSGDYGSLGRVRSAALLWCIRKLGESFPAAVVIVRLHPEDDEYSTASIETGDPAICEAVANEYIESQWFGNLYEAEDE